MASAIKSLEHATSNYCKDLATLTEEQFLQSVGGSARAVVDFTYEVAAVNRRIAKRMAGESVPPANDGWIVAPDELRSKEALTAYLRESSQMVIDAAKTFSPEEAMTVVGPEGFARPIFAWVFFAATHTGYHDAQINFIQSLSGDLEVHWN